ncbi:MAG: S49 family peptidase [Anaerolineae bacterium]|nr:S49 family peptidase [Anaerolineae bacterium]
MDTVFVYLRKIGIWMSGGVAFILGVLVLPWLLVPRPAVGIIRLNSDIWYASAWLIQLEIEEARQDENVKAVIFQVDSPGGEVVASQTLYLELQSLRREMPVVGSIDSMAASGGYYAVMAVDPIYAKPSSSIGNVGVWSYAPEEIGVNDVVLTSGPFKMTGSNRDEFLRELEGIKQEFLATVFSQRGERMQMTPADLSQGLLYPGREAVRLGLIDYIGTETDAIEKAAEQAGIANYKVVDLEARVIDRLLKEDSILLEPWIGAADPMTGERELPHGIYLLYDPRLRGAR